MRSAIDRDHRDLSGTTIGFVGTNSGTNRHRFYWFLNSSLGVFSMKGGGGSAEKNEECNR